MKLEPGAYAFVLILRGVGGITSTTNGRADVAPGSTRDGIRDLVFRTYAANFRRQTGQTRDPEIVLFTLKRR